MPKQVKQKKGAGAVAPTPPVVVPPGLPAMIASQLAAIQSRGPTKPIPVVQKKQRWSDFTLADGSVIRFRPDVVEVLLEIGKYNPTGQPIYHFNMGVNVAVVSPPHLMQGYQPPKQGRRPPPKRLKSASKKKKK
jgi:hypothetical protein